MEVAMEWAMGKVTEVVTMMAVRQFIQHLFYELYEQQLTCIRTS